MINDCFPGASNLFAAASEVRTRCPTLQTSGIDRGRRNALASSHLLSNRCVQQASSRLDGEQSPGGLLNRCVVRNTLQFYDFDQCRMVGQVGNNASIVGFEKVLQNQAGEELMLREDLRTILMRVGRERPTRSGQRCQHDLSRRFTGCCHAFITDACIMFV